MTTKKPDEELSSDERALGRRLSELADLVGGKKEMARLGEISEVQIYRYINGENSPSVRAMVRLAQAADVSVAWLISGEGPRESVDLQQAAAQQEHVLDRALLEHLIRVIHDSETLGTLPADKRAQTIVDVYEQVASSEHDGQAQIRMADTIIATLSRLMS